MHLTLTIKFEWLFGAVHVIYELFSVNMNGTFHALVSTGTALSVQRLDEIQMNTYNRRFSFAMPPSSTLEAWWCRWRPDIQGDAGDDRGGGTLNDLLYTQLRHSRKLGF